MYSKRGVSAPALCLERTEMSKLPSLLFINYSPYGGGSTVALYRLAAGLAGRGYPVGIASPSNRWLEEQIDRNRIRLFRLDSAGGPSPRSMIPGAWVFFFRSLRASIELRKIIRAGSWDVVHVNTLPNFAGAAAARLTKKPWVWHIHEVSFSSPLVFRMVRFSALMLGDIFVCPSASAGALFAGKKPIRIPNGIPDDWADSPKEGVATLKRRFGIKPGHRVVLWIGGIEPRKGLETVLEMLAASPEFEETVFVCAGLTSERYAAYYEHLRVRAEQSCTPVRFVADIPDPRPLYKMSDIVLQTSLVPEAFGLTVLEAMVFGKPVICSGLGGTAEFVRHGVSAHVLADSETETLRSAVSKVLHEPDYAEKIGAGARQAARQFFSSSIIARWEDLFAKLAGFGERPHDNAL